MRNSCATFQKTVDFAGLNSVFFWKLGLNIVIPSLIKNSHVMNMSAFLTWACNAKVRIIFMVEIDRFLKKNINMVLVGLVQIFFYSDIGESTTNVVRTH